jgi:hypothetical protein
VQAIRVNGFAQIATKERTMHNHADMSNRCLYEHEDGEVYCDYDRQEVLDWMNIDQSEYESAFDLAVDCAYGLGFVSEDNDWEIPVWKIGRAHV